MSITFPSQACHLIISTFILLFLCVFMKLGFQIHWRVLVAFGLFEFFFAASTHQWISVYFVRDFLETRQRSSSAVDTFSQCDRCPYSMMVLLPTVNRGSDSSSLYRHSHCNQKKYLFFFLTSFSLIFVVVIRCLAAVKRIWLGIGDPKRRVLQSSHWPRLVVAVVSARYTCTGSAFSNSLRSPTWNYECYFVLLLITVD